MAADKNDAFSKVYQRLSTTLSADKGVGATTATLASGTNFPTTTGLKVSIYNLDTNGNIDATTLCVYRCTLSGSTLSSLTLVEGTDQLHASGSPVSLLFTATHWNDAMTALAAEHNQDGTHSVVTATSVTATGTVQGATVVSTGDIQHRSVSLETIRANFVHDFVASGCVWSGDAYGSTRAASMTSGVVYVSGRRVSLSAVTARTFTASRDTYIDVGTDGVIDYNEVTNNAASPALSADHIRIGIIVTGASNIANVGSVNQGEESKVLPIASSVPYAVTDSLGNLICPRDPHRKVLGMRQRTSNFSTSNTSATQITELSCPVIVPTGRKIKVTLIGSSSYPTTSVTAGPTIGIWEGTVGSGTLKQQTISRAAAVANQVLDPVHVEVVYTPTTSSITLNGALHASAASTVQIDGASTTPMYIKVELV